MPYALQQFLRQKDLTVSSVLESPILGTSGTLVLAVASQPSSPPLYASQFLREDEDVDEDVGDSPQHSFPVATPITHAALCKSYPANPPNQL